MAKNSRRAFLLGSGAAVGVAGSRFFSASNPVLDGTHSISAADNDSSVLNDASELSATPVNSHSIISDPPGDKLRKAIGQQLSRAKSESRSINIGAARHSMGGQAIPRNGDAITFDNDFLEADTAAGKYRVHAGARWSDVIRQLDPIGYSPKVMQSNNDFGVASTYSVNAHGWAVPFGPMGSTVISVNMVLPDGTAVDCSRQQNTELFNHAMGGYGLTGLITELEVQMEPNARLLPAFTELGSKDFAPAFQSALQDPMVNMAYGHRLHATVEQFARTYPLAAEFAAFKREIDPQRRLRNALWDNYLEKL